MPPTERTIEPDAWDQLALYRQRYQIEDKLGPISSLERSIERRRVRQRASRRRVTELQALLDEARRELDAIEGEIAESRRVGAHFIEEILHQVRIDNQEAWTPTPVRGFRIWEVAENGLHGAQQRWDSPTMVADCLRGMPGEDIPHPVRACGPPACGVYATKRIDMLAGEDGRRLESPVAIGVVAMSGKVVEHEQGYRSAMATAVAMVARNGDRSLMTTDEDLIGDLFADPPGVIRHMGKHGVPSDDAIDAFLESARREEVTWISDQSSG